MRDYCHLCKCGFATPWYYEELLKGHVCESCSYDHKYGSKVNKEFLRRELVRWGRRAVRYLNVDESRRIDIDENRYEFFNR